MQKKTAAILSVIFGCYTCVVPSGYAAFLGEFCWLGSDSNELHRYAVTDAGNGHLTVNGRLTDNDDPSQKDVVFGAAEVFGNEVIMNLTYTRSDPSVAHANVSLDLATLNGVITWLDIALPFSFTPWSESLNTVTCP